MEKKLSKKELEMRKSLQRINDVYEDEIIEYCVTKEIDNHLWNAMVNHYNKFGYTADITLEEKIKNYLDAFKAFRDLKLMLTS